MKEGNVKIRSFRDTHYFIVWPLSSYSSCRQGWRQGWGPLSVTAAYCPQCLDKLCEIIVQSTEEPSAPSRTSPFPCLWAKTKFRGHRSSKILGCIPDPQIGESQSAPLFPPSPTVNPMGVVTPDDYWGAACANAGQRPPLSLGVKNPAFGDPAVFQAVPCSVPPNWEQSWLPASPEHWCPGLHFQTTDRSDHSISSFLSVFSLLFCLANLHGILLIPINRSIMGISLADCIC